MPEYFCKCFNLRCTTTQSLFIDDSTANRFSGYAGPYELEAEGIQVVQNKLVDIKEAVVDSTNAGGKTRSWTCRNCGTQLVIEQLSDASSSNPSLYLSAKAKKLEDVQQERDVISSVFGYSPATANQIILESADDVKSIEKDLHSKYERFLNAERMQITQKVARYKYQLEQELQKKEERLRQAIQSLKLTVKDEVVDEQKLLQDAEGNRSSQMKEKDVMDNIYSTMEIIEDFYESGNQPAASGNDVLEDMDADVVGNITERAEDDDAGQKDLYAQSLPIGIPLQDRMKVPITIDENEDENKFIAPHILSARTYQAMNPLALFENIPRDFKDRKENSNVEK